MIAIADLGGAYTGGKLGARIGTEIGACLGNPVTGCAFGAFLGALGAGAYSSWHESQNTKAIFDNFDFDSYIALCDKALHDEDISGIPIEMREKIFVDEKIVKKTDLSSESKRVGKMHNIVLASLQEGVVIETGQHEIKNDTEDYESAILYSDQMKELLLSYASGNYQTEISLSDSVLKLFNNIFEECARNSDDVSIIINKYQSIIETSNELNEDEKYNLSLAFATALYSINYWSE